MVFGMKQKNVLVVTMPNITSGYNPQNVNGGASRAYKDALTGSPAAKIYTSDELALEDGFVPVVAGDVLEAYTQWAAYRNLMHRILYTTVNSNVMMNGLVAAPWSSTAAATLYTPLGNASSISVAGDQVPDGLSVSYVLKSGVLPTGLTLNADGSLTGIATTEGVYSFVVGGYLTGSNWVGMGSGNNTYQRSYTVRVEPLLTYSGDTELVYGQPFTGTFTINPNMLPLPEITARNNTFWEQHLPHHLQVQQTLTILQAHCLVELQYKGQQWLLASLILKVQIMEFSQSLELQQLL